MQEYIFQFGAISKACVTVIICGLALYITQYTKSPPKEGLKVVTFGILAIPVIACAISISFKTSRVYCSWEGSLPYKDSSKETQLAVLAYSMTIIAPIYFCIALDAIFSLLLFIRVRGLDADISGTNTSERDQLRGMVIRMQLYPIIVVISWLPNSLLYILSNAYDINPTVLRIIAVLTLSSSGIGISLNYFYHQRTYPPWLHQVLGYNSVERQSILNTGGEIESSFGSWSEIEGSNSSGTTARPTIVDTVIPRNDSSLSSQPSNNTVERSYSLARKLLPRFDFRSHSSGTPVPLRGGTPKSESTPTNEFEI